MSQSAEKEGKEAVAPPPKPPLPSMPSGDAGSVKSDSFRRVDYTPPEGAASSKSEETLLGSFIRRLSGRAAWGDGSQRQAAGKQSPAEPPVSSDAVVEELSRKASLDLPPLPPTNSTPPQRTDSGRVGLQTVKLVALDQPPVAPTASDASTEKKPQEKEGDEHQTTAPTGDSASTSKDESKETKETSVAPVSGQGSSDKEGSVQKTTEVAVPVQGGESTEVVRPDASKAESGVAKLENRSEDAVAIQTEAPAAAVKTGEMESTTGAAASKGGEAVPVVGGETHARDTVTVVAVEKEGQPSEKTSGGEAQLVNPEAASLGVGTGGEESKAATGDEAKGEMPAVAAAKESTDGEGALVTKEGDKETASQVLENAEGKQYAPTLAASRIPGVGGSMQLPESHETDQALRHSATSVGAGGSRPGFFRKLFSFGGGRASEKIIEGPEQDEEKEDSAATKETETSPAEKQASAKLESTTTATTTSAEEPSESGKKSPPPATEQTELIEAAVASTEPVNTSEDSTAKHFRVSSELTPVELNSLKMLFMDEMKKKGIDVEQKYTKSSTDFDSPLMFLLDLHTFAETQQSSIRLEHVLKDRYGDETSIVTEVNDAAAARAFTTTPLSVETQTKHGESDEPKGDSSSGENYESGLDTAKDSAHDETKTATVGAESSSESHTATVKQAEDVTPTTTAPTPKLEESVSKEQEESKKASSSSPSSPSTVESKATGSDKAPDDQLPPETGRLHDETIAVTLRGCFWCRACIAPPKAQ